MFGLLNESCHQSILQVVEDKEDPLVTSLQALFHVAAAAAQAGPLIVFIPVRSRGGVAGRRVVGHKFGQLSPPQDVLKSSLHYSPSCCSWQPRPAALSRRVC
jgi:hypothetical protein